MTGKLMLKNLKSFITGTPLAFLLVVVLEMFGIIAVVLSYGVIQNVFAEQEQETEFSRRYSFSRNIGENDERNTWDDTAAFLNSFEKLTDEFGSELSNAFCSGRVAYEGVDYVSGFSYYPSADTFANNVGSGYNDYISGKKLVQVGTPELNKSVGDKLTFNGTEYTVSKVRSREDTWAELFFYYTAVPDNIKISSVTLDFEDIPTHERVDELNALVHELFGYDFQTFEPEIPDLLIKQFGAVSLGMCSAIMLIVVFNCITVYMYIFQKRQRWLAVVKLCGCKSSDCMAIFLGEAMLVTVVCSIAGVLLSQSVIIPRLEEYYAAFKTVYTPISYVYLAGAYCFVSLIIFSVTVEKYVSETVDAMRKEAV